MGPLSSPEKKEKMNSLPLSFYTRSDVIQVAKDLLGKYLLTHIDGVVTGGMIIETEAYRGAEDRACHAYNNRRTKRTEVMFQEGGVAYVYLCYGMHNLFNVVTHQKDTPHAILIRAIEPEVGLETMQKRRKTDKLSLLSSGPGKVSQALGIDTSHTGQPLEGAPLWIEDRGKKFKPEEIEATPRIGVAYAKEDALLPYRFILRK